MSMQILTRDVPPRTAWTLEQAGVHPLLSRLFAARGIQSADELDDGLAKLLPPHTLKGTEAAAILLADAIAAQPVRVTDPVYEQRFNRRVFEALVKSGACDSLAQTAGAPPLPPHVSRARLMRGVEKFPSDTVPPEDLFRRSKAPVVRFRR